MVILRCGGRPRFGDVVVLDIPPLIYTTGGRSATDSKRPFDWPLFVRLRGFVPSLCEIPFAPYGAPPKIKNPMDFEVAESANSPRFEGAECANSTPWRRKAKDLASHCSYGRQWRFQVLGAFTNPMRTCSNQLLHWHLSRRYDSPDRDSDCDDSGSQRQDPDCAWFMDW